MGIKATLGLLLGATVLAATGCTGTLAPGSNPQAPQAPQAPPVVPAQPPANKPLPGEIPQVPPVSPVVPVSPPANQNPNQSQKSVNVDFLKRVFYAMDYNQKTTVINGWSSVKGSPQLEDAFLFQFVQGINDDGVVTNATGKPLTNAEAREFLDWALTIGAT